MTDVVAIADKMIASIRPHGRIFVSPTTTNTLNKPNTKSGIRDGRRMKRYK